jgi:anti-sigma B factor antagonist
VTILANIRKVEGVQIVDLTGRITIGEETSVLRETLKTLLQNNHTRVLLNLADVTYIDSSGLGELVNGFTNFNRLGGKLKLLNLTKKVHDLLSITKLLTVFEVFEDEAKAIQSLQ